MARSFCLVCALGVFLLGGCAGGDQEPSIKVSGSVTFDGKPLDKGTILFYKAGEPGAPNILPIAGGSFSGPVTVGKKKVSIMAYKEAKTPAAAGKEEGPQYVPDSPQLVNYIPAEYNVKSKIFKDITLEGPNVLTFKLEKK